MKKEIKKTVKSFRLQTDVWTKLDLDAQRYNMSTSKYLERLIMNPDKAIYNQENIVKAAYNLTRKIQTADVSDAVREILLEEVGSLWRGLF